MLIARRPPLFLSLILPGLIFIHAQRAESHPLQAQPVNHPYVFGFDQFFLPEDPDEHLIEGGLLLLAELRCTACHQAPKPWAQRLSPAPAPDLSEVGSRMRSDSIWKIARSPQHTKRGTLMPGLFTGEEGDAEDVEAITEFLSSLKRPKDQPVDFPTGNTESGKRLYHRIGCVACHEPATDYRPSTLPPEGEVEKPGLASVPLVLAEAYLPEELAAFLHNPLRTRPAGHMPSQHLSLQEASDIAAYLQMDEVFEPALERSVLNVPPQGVAKGRQTFLARNCNACHETTHADASKEMGTSLQQMKLTDGCLSESRASGVPHYRLNPNQRRAIQLAIEEIQQHASKSLPYDALGWELSRMNCYACHDRSGKGGPETPRAQYFSAKPLPTSPGYHMFPIPRSLDGVGERLKPNELQQSLRGSPAAEGETTLRMPDFGPSRAKAIADLLDRLSDSR